MQIHTIKRKHPHTKTRRVGRGQGSKRGKTSGRGGKGQTARAGNKRRPEWRDIIKKLPKRRGYGKNRAQSVNGERVRPVIVSLDLIIAAFEKGGTVSPKELKDMGIIAMNGKFLPKVKIVGGKEKPVAMTFTGLSFSNTVKEQLEKAGATIK